MSQLSKLGKLIAKACIDDNLTGQKLADGLGISTAYISGVMRGKKYLSYSRSVELLKLLPSLDKQEYWQVYISERPTLSLACLSEKKQKLIASILQTDLDDKTITKIGKLINER